MSDYKWIKIVTNIFDDEKIRFIETMPNGDSLLVLWFKILCLCGKSNTGGYLMFTDKLAYTDEMLASMFNRDIKIIKLALKVFEELSMVEILDERFYVTNWCNHQSLDSQEKKKLYDREYQRRKREEKRLSSRTTVGRLPNDSRLLEIDKEKEKELDLIKEKKQKKGSVFQAPSLKEVEEFCKENNINIDFNAFYSHYTSNGWMIGSNSMKDWKAAINSWKIRKNGEKQEGLNKYTTGGFEEL